MFNNRHYVPILKAKGGELRAVETAGGKGTAFTPLFEISRTDQTIPASAAAINNAWNTASQLFIDAIHVEDAAAPFGDGTIDAFSVAAHPLGLQVIPVTGLYRSPAQQAATRAAAARHGQGACVRLTIEDIDDPATLDTACTQLAAAIGLTPDRLHAVIDLSEVAAQFQNATRHMVCDAIHQSTFLRNHAQTLTVAGTAFPSSMSGIPADSITAVARSEWPLYLAIRHAPADRLPTFGDYAASHPAVVEFDPETMRPAAKITYTVDLAWLIAKGRAVHGPAGFGQYHGLSRLVRDRHEFRGPGFSTGDQTIATCAVATNGTGNLTTWVMVKVSHHIAHVVDQLASLP